MAESALIGLMLYLITYWCDPAHVAMPSRRGGAFNGLPEEFVRRLSALIFLGRMARVDEYRAAIVGLCSYASPYISGSNRVIDNGRSCR